MYKRISVYFLFFFLWLFALSVHATTYYVCKGGQGTKSGNSLANAMTISSMNSTLSPGDTANLYDDCGTFTTIIKPVNSGTSSNPIVIQAATGETPIVSRGTELTGWSSVGNGIYRTNASGYKRMWEDPFLRDCETDTTRFCASVDLVNSEDHGWRTLSQGEYIPSGRNGFYYDQGGFTYLRSNKAVDPDSLTIIANKRKGDKYVMDLSNASYITIDGITFRFGLVESASGRRNQVIQNSRFEWTGGLMLQWTGTSYNTFKNNVVIGGGSYRAHKGDAIYIGKYTLIENNKFLWGGHGQIYAQNQTDGFNVIRGNIFHDCGGSHTVVESDWTVVENNEYRGSVSKNLLKAHRADHYSIRLRRDNNIIRFNRAWAGEGGWLVTSLGGGQSASTRIEDNAIYHNTVTRIQAIQGNRGSAAIGANNEGDPRDILIVNNILAENDIPQDNDYSQIGEANSNNLQTIFTDVSNNIMRHSSSSNVFDGQTISTREAQFSGWYDNRSGDPKFINYQRVGPNFQLDTGSDAIDTGRCLTQANGQGVNSTTLIVDDGRYFTDGFGIVDGDDIKIGTNDPVEITDRNGQTLTLASAKTWSNNDCVSFDYNGTKPDIGAFESGASPPPPNYDANNDTYGPYDLSDPQVTQSVLGNDVNLTQITEITVDVTLGTAAINGTSDGILYTPPTTGQGGVDFYVYKACDAGGTNCDTATVTMTINPPVAGGGGETETPIRNIAHYDFTPSTFGSYQSVDVSSVVSSEATGVGFTCYNANTSGREYVGVRNTSGTVDHYHQINTKSAAQLFMGIDGSDTFEIKIESADVSCETRTELTGEWTWFTGASDRSITVTCDSTWNTYSASSHFGTDTALLAIVEMGAASTIYDAGVRTTGSTFTANNNVLLSHEIVGLNGTEQFDYFCDSGLPHMGLIGYYKGSATLVTLDDKESSETIGSTADVFFDLAQLPADQVGACYWMNFDGLSEGIIRKKGDTTETVYAKGSERVGMFCADADENRYLEAKCKRIDQCDIYRAFTWEEGSPGQPEVCGDNFNRSEVINGSTPSSGCIGTWTGANATLDGTKLTFGTSTGGGYVSTGVNGGELSFQMNAGSVDNGFRVNALCDSLCALDPVTGVTFVFDVGDDLVHIQNNRYDTETGEAFNSAFGALPFDFTNSTTYTVTITFNERSLGGWTYIIDIGGTQLTAIQSTAEHRGQFVGFYAGDYVSSAGWIDALSVKSGDAADSSVPTAPVLTCTNSQLQVDCSWTESTDASGIDRYLLKRDSTEVCTVRPGETLECGDGPTAGSYTYTVTAYDNAGRSTVSNNQAVDTSLQTNTAPVFGTCEFSVGANDVIDFLEIGSSCVTDADNDTIVVSSVDTQPDSGSVAVTDPLSGQVRYVGEYGTSSTTLTFDVTVSDQNGGTDTGTVTLNVASTKFITATDDPLHVGGETFVDENGALITNETEICYWWFDYASLDAANDVIVGNAIDNVIRGCDASIDANGELRPIDIRNSQLDSGDVGLLILERKGGLKGRRGIYPMTVQ